MLSLWIFSLLILIGIFQGDDAIYPKEGPSVSLAEPGEFPYMVMVYVVLEKNDIRACAGAIIDQTHILTAAHCVFYAPEKRIVIIAGKVYREWSGAKKSRITAIHFPEELRDDRQRFKTWYRNHTMASNDWQTIRDEIKRAFTQNDIAVLTLSNALSFGDNIQAINLPDSSDLPYCQFCKFAGWGRNEKNGQCADRLYWIRMMILKDPINEMNPSREFKAQDPMLETCPLQGDSGAPLVFNNTVYGIHTKNNRDPYSSSTFSNVFAHINFIRKALEN